MAEQNPRFFVAVHVGAGYHAPSNEKSLRSAMKCACLAAASILRKVFFQSPPFFIVYPMFNCRESCGNLIEFKLRSLHGKWKFILNCLVEVFVFFSYIFSVTNLHCFCLDWEKTEERDRKEANCYFSLSLFFIGNDKFINKPLTKGQHPCRQDAY